MPCYNPCLTLSGQYSFIEQITKEVRSLMFILKSIMLGVGLSMDAVAVSMTNGLQRPKMSERKKAFIAFTFGLFQFFMPLIGFFVVTSFARLAPILMRYVAVISNIILLYLSAKMLIGGLREKKEERTEEKKESLLLQAVGTSIDALSLGFTFSHDPTPEVFVSTLIIGAVTFSLSYIALFVGKKFGTIYAGKADVVGGVVLALVAIFL